MKISERAGARGGGVVKTDISCDPVDRTFVGCDLRRDLLAPGDAA